MPKFFVLIFAIVILIFATLTLPAEIKIAECQNGVCVISEEMLDKLVQALEHWYTKAKDKCA